MLLFDERYIELIKKNQKSEIWATRQKAISSAVREAFP